MPHDGDVIVLCNARRESKKISRYRLPKGFKAFCFVSYLSFLFLFGWEGKEGCGSVIVEREKKKEREEKK